MGQWFFSQVSALFWLGLIVGGLGLFVGVLGLMPHMWPGLIDWTGLIVSLALHLVAALVLFLYIWPWHFALAGLLIFSGLLCSVLDVVMYRRLDLLLGGLGLLFSLLVLLLFAFVPCPGVRPLPATKDPGAVLIGLAFTPQEMTNASIIPGPGNEDLAACVLAHAGSVDLILAQEAIIVALPPGTPSERMHAHDTSAYVRNYEALCWACQRLNNIRPKRIYLIVHDKQWDRAYRALRTMYDGEIIGPCCTGVRYEVPCHGASYWDSWWRPQWWRPRLRWAARELVFARPLEFIQGCLFRFYPQVSFPPISPPPSMNGTTP